jgi:enoyl-CoA hydratase/carnithine racemase
MSFSTITVVRHRSAAILTFARPERRNAFNLQMMQDVVKACGEIGDSPEVRALVVTGGAGVFSAGADLTEALKVATTDDSAHFFGSLHNMNAAVERLNKPVIAAIEGPCITGGCEFALACDLRFAGAGATFAITSSRIGTIAGAGGTQRLPRIVGISNALAMLYSAEAIGVDEAFRIGLVNKKTAKGGAVEAALALVDTYAERAPLSLALTKQAVRQGIELGLDAGLALEIDLVTKIYGTQDKQEGISAFLEKRKPRFTGS